MSSTLYGVLALVAVLAGTATFIAIRSYKAGKNSAKLDNADKEIADQQHDLETSQAMNKAAANAPKTKEALESRLDKGTFSVLILLPLLCLSSCGERVVYKSLCPQPISYSRQEQAGLSSELKSHTDLIYVPQFLEDYESIEDQLRVVSPKR